MKLCNRLKFAFPWGDSRRRYCMAEVLHLRGPEFAFHDVETKVSLPDARQRNGQVANVVEMGGAVDEYVVNVCYNIRRSLHDDIHQAAETGWCAHEALWGDFPLELAYPGNGEGREMFGLGIEH